jgi:hypothetical protein
VPVHDLAQHTEMGELVAGTHGRSVWICDNSVIGQITEETLKAPFTLFEPKDVHLRARGKSRGSAGIQGFRATNPRDGASFMYAITERAREASIQVLDASGNVVADLEATNERGLHRVDWNLRSRSSGEGRGRRRGGRATPGPYVVRLTVDGDSQSQVFTVHNDPDQPTTEWNLIATEGSAADAPGTGLGLSRRTAPGTPNSTISANSGGAIWVVPPVSFRPLTPPSEGPASRGAIPQTS